MQLDTSSPYGRINTVADASVDERAAFIVRTYVHLAGAVFAFVALEAALFFSGIAHAIAPLMFGRLSWIIVMLAFMGVAYLADRWARNTTSLPLQYAGLGLYVVAQAVLFVPLIGIALVMDQGSTWSESIIGSAAIVTLVLFGGLTGVVFVTRRDFSFLRAILGVGVLGAVGVMICALIFGFSLGIVFSGAMVVLAGGYILYNTSNVLHHYRTDQHVSAALTLFADVALLFWWVLRIFMSRR